MNKRNKNVIIFGAVLLGVALGIFLLSLVISGYDFNAFFHSNSFIWICVIIGIYVIGVVAILIMDKINKL